MGKCIFLFLIVISEIFALEYQLHNGIATFRLNDDETTISGVPRNAQGVVRIKLSCGLNSLPVENSLESSLELIHNCVQSDSRLVGLYLNSTWTPLSELNDEDEVTIGVEVRYQSCFDDGVDRCDGSLWWLQVGGNEVAVLRSDGKCESGDIEEDYGQMMCKRKQNVGKSAFISDEDGVLYDGQLIKAGKTSKVIQYGKRKEQGGFAAETEERYGRRITCSCRFGGFQTNTCDYTLESTSTSTTTASTTTETTTTESTTVTTTPTSTSTLTSTTESTSTSTESTTSPTTSTTEVTSTESTSESTSATSSTTESPTTVSTSTENTSTSSSTVTTRSTSPSSTTTKVTSTTEQSTTSTSTSSSSSSSTSTSSTSVSSTLSTVPSSSTTVITSTSQGSSSSTTLSTSPSSTAVTSPSTSAFTTLSTTLSTTKLTTTGPATTVEPLPANAICSYLDETTTSTTVTTTETSTTTEPTSSTTVTSTTTPTTSTPTTSTVTTTDSTTTQTTSASSTAFSPTSSSTTTSSSSTPQTTSISSSSLSSSTSSSSSSSPSTSTSVSSSTSQSSSSASSSSSSPSDSSSSSTGSSPTSPSTSSVTSSSDSDTTTSGEDVWVKSPNITYSWSDDVVIVVTSSIDVSSGSISYECKNSTSDFVSITTYGTCFADKVHMSSRSSTYPATKFVSTGVYTLKATVTRLADGANFSTTFTVTITDDSSSTLDASTTQSASGDSATTDGSLSSATSTPTIASEDISSSTEDSATSGSVSTSKTSSSTSSSPPTASTSSLTSSDSTSSTNDGSSPVSTSSSDSATSGLTSSSDLSTSSVTTGDSASSSATDGSVTGTQTSTGASVDSTTEPYDFTLKGYSWNETIYFNSTTLSVDIDPVTNDGSLATVKYLCRNDSTQPFLSLGDGNCLPENEKVLGAAYSSGLSFSVESTGVLEFIITVTDPSDATRTATHNFTLNILPVPSTTGVPVSTTTQSGNSEATGNTDGNSGSTSSSAISATDSSAGTGSSDSSASGATGATSDTFGGTTDSSGGTGSSGGISGITTPVVYDFYLNGASWNETIYYSEEPFAIDPVPNISPITKSVSYLCRNDTSDPFVSLETSNCLTEIQKNRVTFSTSASFNIPGPGVYQFIITVTNRDDSTQTATHNFTLNVLAETTTSGPSTTSSDASQSDSSDGTSASTDSSGASGATGSTSASSGTDGSSGTGATGVTSGSDTSGATGSSDSTGGGVTGATEAVSGVTGSTDVSAASGATDSTGSTGKNGGSDSSGATGTTDSSGGTGGTSGTGTTRSSGVTATSGTGDGESTGGSTTASSGSEDTSGGTGATGSDGSDKTTQKSTRARGVLSTATPISAAEQAAIDAQKADVASQLAAIIDGSAASSSLNTSSSLLNQISTLPASDLVEVAQSLLSNTLKISGVGNMSNVDVLTTLKNNIATTNSELATEMGKVISQLAAVNMTSAESMNSVLSSLDLALKGSTVYTLGVSSTKSTDGTYAVIFGYVLANGYTLVSPRCTLSVYGSTVYVTGDTRASYLQQTGDTVTANSILTALGIQGSYTKNGRTVVVDQDLIEQQVSLVSGCEMDTLSGTGDVQSGEYTYSSMYVTAWNVSYDNTTAGSTSQINTSMSFWLPATSAQLSLSIESGTSVKLQSTQSVAAQKLVVTTSYGGVTYTVTCLNGTAKFIEIGTNSSIFSYNTDSFTVTSSDGSSTTTMQKMIQLPVVIENVAVSLFDSTSLTSPLSFSAYGSYPLRIVLSPQDTSLPSVSAISQSISISTLSPTTTYSQSDLKALISNQTLITVTGTLIFAKTSSIDVSGYTFYADSSAVYLQNSVTTIVLSSPTYNVVSLTLGGYGIQITAGSYTSGSQTHVTTMMEFSDTQKMRIDGGLVIRNGTNGYVIQNGKVSTEGEVSGTKIDIVPQSLMNQESQQQIATILSNTQTYLENNGMTMTDEQINDTSNSLLSIASSLTSALKTALDNPLSSDLAANLEYATTNYDSLYNVLPSDPDNIVYVEEMTSDEWAAYVTKMVQKSIAKTLANQLASTLDTLENTLAARAIATGNLPYDYTNSVDGTGMVIVIDDASNIVGKTQSCNEWNLTLPSPASTLNNAAITDSTLIQVGMVCYDTNPRTYVDNFDMLITSGALEAHIKDENQNNIEVSGTTSPIVILGHASDDDEMMTLMQQGDFASYQILDVHAFRTTNWNNSVQIQIVASQDYDIPANDDTYMFSAFQSLPGPLEGNHEWQFELNSLNSSSTYYVSANALVNNTGLFYLGIGKRNGTASGNNSDTVDYGTYDSKQWSFARQVPMDYQVTAISKGCYYYLNSTDMFNSDGMSPVSESGMQYVKCTSDHLTLFSVGSFNPTINADFEYNYSVNDIEKNVKVMITAIFILIVYGCLTINDLICNRKDASRGRLRFLSDNEPHDGYMYILSVETGYRMFATTDSTISFNLSGTEGDQIFRSFKAEEDGDWEYPFSWGTTSRFVMTTAFPLGQLEYVRLWIDDAGLDHRESWYCNRIIVKDLQTQEIYYFPFNNWLGTKNGDGETERLARVDYRRRFMDESMSMHMLGQTISWFAMFTGGGNRLRDRVSRLDYSVSVIFSIILSSIISIIVLKNEGSTSTSSTSFSEFSFTAKDIILGIVYGILITLFSSVHILLCCKCRSSSEEKYYKKRKEEEPGFRDPSGSWSGLISGISRMIIPFPILIGVVFIGGDGMSLMDDFANSFYMRFLISLIVWVIVFEPLKGMIWAFFILKTSKSHKISNKLEEAFLRVKPAETFLRNPYGKIEKELGTVIADVTKLRDTENRKMRDEQLFVTLRDMLCFFVSLYIMVMLTFYCRDRQGFYYQQEMSTILNIPQGTYGDNTFMSIRSSDDFWVWSRESLATAMLASWYDGNPAYGMRAYLNDKVSRSMGIGTIRQVRTKKSAQCEIVQQFRNYIDDCGEEISKENEETTQYMKAGWTELDTDNGTDASEEYTYKTEKELQTGTVSGNLNSYGGGGYTVSLSGTVAEMQATFDKLESERWIDEFTRAVIIEFSTYNAQINYFSVVQLLVEIPKSGIYLPISWVESVRLIKSEGSDGNVVKYYEMLYIFFSVLIFFKEIFYYLYGRYKVITTMKRSWNPFKLVYRLIFGHFTPWNFMDLVVGALAVASVIAYILRQKYTNEAMDMFIANNGNSYINLTKQRNTELAFGYCLAGAVFFTSCKMIRILRFNRRIGVLAATLDSALGAIVAFGVAFVLFCMAFNSVAYSILGNKMAGYRSTIATFETSLAGMLGKLDVTSIKPISQFAFVVIMIFMIVGSKLVLQLYVTIIMFEFEEIRNDSEKQTNDYEIIDHIRYKTKRRLGLLEPKDFSPVSIADTQKDFRLFHSAVAKVNLLHHRVTRLLQTNGQYKNETIINYTRSYDPVAAIDRNGPKRFEKWRLNDVEGI